MKRTLMLAVIAVAIYLIAWNLMIRLPSAVENTISHGTNLQFSANVGVLVMRYEILPIYWSMLGGSLWKYHYTFTIILFAVIARNYYIHSKQNKEVNDIVRLLEEG